MVNPVDRYLVETEIHLRGRMSPEELEATLSETEQHLRERMEALRELGREPQMASQEAVQAFGPVGLYVHSLMDARRPGQRRLDNAVATWAAVGCAVGSLQLLMFDWPLWQAALLFCLTSLIAVFIGSIRSRKAVPVRISAIAAVAGTAAWLLSPMFFARLGDYGGIGYLPLREASSIYASVPQRERDLAWL